MRTSKIEACIAWAKQNGYSFAQGAALELGTITNRIMTDDDNTAMYGTQSWRDKTKEERRVR